MNRRRIEREIRPLLIITFIFFPLSSSLVSFYICIIDMNNGDILSSLWNIVLVVTDVIVTPPTPATGGLGVDSLPPTPSTRPTSSRLLEGMNPALPLWWSEPRDIHRLGPCFVDATHWFPGLSVLSLVDSALISGSRLWADITDIAIRLETTFISQVWPVLSRLSPIISVHIS